MRLAAHRDLHKALQRARLLYEVTMHSYGVLYETGREALRNPEQKGKTVELRLGAGVVKRPLKVITYQARDVYPELFRSTLLVQIIAAYEAFLIDCVEEISLRTRDPFLNDSRLEFSQEQLLTIDAEECVFRHIVNRTLRRLTSGGLKEIRKFYQRNLETDLIPDSLDFNKVEELHDRRHLFVHRSGYVDAEYVSRHGFPGAVVDKRLQVSEAYLAEALQTLEVSGLHIKKALETRYPEPPRRRYIAGDIRLPEEPEHLLYVSFVTRTAPGRAGFEDLSLELDNGKTLKNIVVWMSDDGFTFRMLIGSDSGSIAKLYNVLRDRSRAGSIKLRDSFKIKR